MKKKALIILCIAMMLCLLSVFASCGKGSYAMTDFIVNREAIQEEYSVGDAVDLSKLVCTASFNDGNSETIPLDKVTVKVDGTEITDGDYSVITATTGQKTIEILYSDKVCSFVLEVKEKHIPVLTGVKMDAENVKKEYLFGDAVTMDGLKVYAVYDGTDETELALSDVTVLMGEEKISDNFNKVTESVGAKVIKVKYDVFETTTTFVINVADVFEKIEIDVTKVKTSYKVAEEVAAPSVAAKAVYKSGKTVDIAEIKYYSGTEEVDFATLTATAGDKTVTAKVSYEGKDASATITYTVANYITGIAVKTNEVLLNYVMDDEISIETFAAVTIAVSYKDSAADNEIPLTAVGVECLNALGEAVDFASLTQTEGTKTVTVRYAEKEATFSFNVVSGESSLESLTVTAPTKTSYTAGETDVTLEGLAITAVYKEEFKKANDVFDVADFAENGVKIYLNDKEVTDYDDITKVSALGETELTLSVKYEGKTDSCTLIVTNNVLSIALNTENVKKDYLLEEDVDFSQLVVTATLDYGTATKSASDVTFYDGDSIVTDLNDFSAAVATAKTVTVSYCGETADFTITVTDYVVSVSLGTKTSFVCDVDVTAGATKTSFEGLDIYAHYKSGAKIALATGFTFSGNDITVPGEKTVTVTYGEFTAQFSLTVNDVLSSITVSTVPTVAYGADVNLTGLTVTGAYAYAGNKIINILQEDGKSFLYSVGFEIKKEGSFVSVTQLELNEISTKSGDNEMRLSYTDNGKTVSATFTLTVTEPKPGIQEYSEPTALTTYKETKAYALKYQEDVDSTEFESAFFTSADELYLVGDDNAYKFIPNLTQINIETEQETVLTTFQTTSTVTLKGETDVVLTATVSGDEKSFKDGDTVYVVENFKKNTFDFTADAIGKVFKLSVLPDKEVFGYEEGDCVAAEQIVKIVDGYNITDSRELCLLEQSNRTIWNGIKAQLKLTNVKPSSIILHQNTIVTKDSIPDDFYYTLGNDYNIQYVKDSTVKTPEEWGLSRTYLWDGEYGLFEYYMAQGSSFTIHGNYFDIDLSKMPLVAAFEPVDAPSAPGGELDGTYYGQYMSKVSFLEVHGVEATKAGNSGDETFSFSNFAVKGNASIDQLLVDTSSDANKGKESPVYGGGLIFEKTVDCTATITNIQAHACFIPFFSRDNTNVTYDRVKGYDSFQNAMFILEDTVNTLTNCHLKRAGGPLFILTEGDRKTGDATTVPTVPIVRCDSDCKLECPVTGQTQWFVTYSASESVARLAALDALLNGYFQKTFLKDGKFNVIAITVKEGGLTAGDAGTQAYFQYGNTTLDRLHNADGSLNVAQQFSQLTGSVTFAANGSFCAVGMSGKDYILINNTGAPIAPQNPTDPVTNAFMYGTDDFIVINTGSMGIVTGLYDYVA